MPRSVFEIAEFLAVDLIRSQTVECGTDPVKRWYRPLTLAKVMAPRLLLGGVTQIFRDDWQRVRVHGAEKRPKCFFSNDFKTADRELLPFTDILSWRVSVKTAKSEFPVVIVRKNRLNNVGSRVCHILHGGEGGEIGDPLVADFVFRLV